MRLVFCNTLSVKMEHRKRERVASIGVFCDCLFPSSVVDLGRSWLWQGWRVFSSLVQACFHKVFHFCDPFPSLSTSFGISTIQLKSRSTILSLESVVLPGGRSMALEWHNLLVMTCSGVLSFPSGWMQGSQAGVCLPPWNWCQQGCGSLVGAAPNPRYFLSVEGDKAFWEEQWEMKGSQWQKQNYLRARAAWCTGTVAISSKPSGALAKQTAGHGCLNHPCCPEEQKPLDGCQDKVLAPAPGWHKVQADLQLEVGGEQGRVGFAYFLSFHQLVFLAVPVHV